MSHDAYNPWKKHFNINSATSGAGYVKQLYIELITIGAIITVGLTFIFSIILFITPNSMTAYGLSGDDNGRIAANDDLIEVNGNPRLYPGGSTVMNYWIQQVGTACDPKLSAVTISINMPYSSDVTAKPSSLTFQDCSKPESITFGSSKPGAYPVTIFAPTGYKTSSAAFTLYVSSSIPATSSSSNTANSEPNVPVPTNQAPSTPASTAISSRPTLYLPSAPTYVEATGPAATPIRYAVNAIDSSGNSITPLCSPSSGSLFPLGKTTVTCTAKDASGHTQSGSFEIVVQDTTPPDLSIPSTAITAEATSSTGASVSFPVSASDIVSGSINPTCITFSSHTIVTSGSLFPLGKTTVTCTAKDASGNTQSGSFEIVVQDTTPPDLTFAGANLVARAHGPRTAVSYATFVSSSDQVDGITNPSCSPSSGSLLPVGTTAVKCTATDKHGNSVSESFTINVRYPTFSGFLPPIHQDGSSIFRLGSVIPVRFQLKWSNGDYVGNAVAQIYNAKISSSVTGTSIQDDSSLTLSSDASSSSSSGTVSTAASGNYFTYDLTKHEYVYYLQTKDLSAGTWQIKIILDDGSSPSVNISLQR